MMIYKKGFTLIETLITGLISSFVLAGLIFSMVLGVNISQEVVQESFLSNMMNIAQQDIIRNVRNSALVEVTDIKSGNKVVGEKLRLLSSDNSTICSYYSYNSDASSRNKNKIFKEIGTSSSNREELFCVSTNDLSVRMLADFELPSVSPGVTLADRVDINLTYTFWNDISDKLVKEKAISTIATKCRMIFQN